MPKAKTTYQDEDKYTCSYCEQSEEKGSRRRRGSYSEQSEEKGSRRRRGSYWRSQKGSRRRRGSYKQRGGKLF